MDISSYSLQRGLSILVNEPLPRSFIGADDGQITAAVSLNLSVVDTLIAAAIWGHEDTVTIEFDDGSAAEYRVVPVDAGPRKRPTTLTLTWNGIAFKDVQGADVRITRKGRPLFGLFDDPHPFSGQLIRAGHQ